MVLGEDGGTSYFGVSFYKPWECYQTYIVINQAILLILHLNVTISTPKVHLYIHSILKCPFGDVLVLI